MKILKNTDTIQVTCQGCKSVLEITKFDIKYESIFGHGVRIEVQCPVCDRFIRVRDLIPHRWLEWLVKTFDTEEDDVHG